VPRLAAWPQQIDGRLLAEVLDSDSPRGIVAVARLPHPAASELPCVQGATYVFAQDAAAPEYDRSLAWAGLLLMAIGVVMVYSASIATAEASRFTGASAAFFLLRHALYLGVALAAALVVFLLPLRFWQKSAPLVFLASLTWCCTRRTTRCASTRCSRASGAACCRCSG